MTGVLVDGSPSNVASWKVLLGVRPDIETCLLDAFAMGADADALDDGIDHGAIAEHTIYPQVVWHVELDGTCGSETLSPESMVWDGTTSPPPIFVDYPPPYRPDPDPPIAHLWRPDGTTTCIPKTCAELLKGCGTWDDGCGGTVSCDLCFGADCDPVTGECACTPDTPSACPEGAECGQLVDWCSGTTLDCGTCLGACDITIGQCTCEDDDDCPATERCHPSRQVCVGEVVEIPPAPLLMGCVAPAETASCDDATCRACTCQDGTCCEGQDWSWDCAVRAGEQCAGVCGCAASEPCCRLVPFCTPFTQPPTMVNGMAFFQIDRDHVTAAQYNRCVAYGVCSPSEPPATAPPDTTAWSFEEAATFRAEGKGDHPINYVTWAQAMTYCAVWAGGHLCTEAEWEAAARGTPPDQRWPYPWGTTPDTAPGDFCAYGVVNGVHGSSAPADAGCGGGGTAPVGGTASGASSHGVMGLAGNVKDHVRNAFLPYPCAADTGAPCSAGGGSGVVRGAAFFEHDVDMFAYRRGIWPRSASSPGVGLRCCFGPLN